MTQLKSFYEDKNTREAVKEFFLNELKLLAVDRVFKKEDVIGVYEAKEVIERSFITLEEIYGKKEKPVIESVR